MLGKGWDRAPADGKYFFPSYNATVWYLEDNEPKYYAENKPGAPIGKAVWVQELGTRGFLFLALGT
jgi:hypothetical protein